MEIFTTRKILSFAVAAGALFVSIFLIYNYNIYRDVAFCYAYAVREAAGGDWRYTLDAGLPVMTMLSASFLAQCGIKAYDAVMLVTGLFYIATIFPLYYLLKRFISPLWAAWGCLAFIFAPKIIRFSCAGLPESPRNFFLISSLLLLFMLFDKITIKRLFLAGLCLAGLCISRSEGLAVAGFFCLLFLFGMLWIDRRNISMRVVAKSCGYSVALGLIILFILLPRLYYNYRESGYPSTDTRYNQYLKHYLFFDHFFTLPSDVPTPPDDFKTTQSANSYGIMPRIGYELQNMSRGGYELYFFPALFGILLVIFGRLRKIYAVSGITEPEIVKNGWRMEYTCIFLLILFHTTLYAINSSAYRYYTLVLPLLLIFTLIPFAFLQKLASRWRWTQICFIATVVIMAVGQSINALSFVYAPDYLEEQKCAEYLNSHIKDFLPDYKGQRVRVYCKYPEVVFATGFYMTNSSIVCKSRKLENKKFDFDLAVFKTDIDEDQKLLIKQLGLEHVPTPLDQHMKVYRYMK